MRKTLVWLGWLGWAVASAGAQAQTPGGADLGRAAVEADRAIQLQQQREREERARLEAPQRRPGGAVLGVEPGTADAGDGRCFDIDQIALDGASLLSPAERASLTASYTNRCVGLPQINELLQDITNFYVARGYVTSRAYVPPQDMGTGTLRILVIEGVLEKIEAAPTSAGHMNLTTAFPGLEGKAVNLRDIEQGIDQINRLQSNNAAIDIASGDKPGGSRLIVTNAARKRWFGNLAVDNTGQDSTGKYQGALSLGYDDPLRLNDLVNVSVRHNLDGHFDDTESRAASLYYAVPFGYWLASLSYSDFEYTSLVSGAVTDFDTAGTTRTGNLRLDRVLFRDQTRKLTVSLGLTKKDSRNFILGELIENNSRDLTILDASMNTSTSWQGVLLFADVGVSKGLRAFGALHDLDAQPDAAPKAQFTRLNFSLNASRPFQIGSFTLVYAGQINGQYSPDVLFGTEQFLIGGPFSVRGYRDTSLSSDTGLNLRNDLRLPVALDRLVAGAPAAARLEPYLGVDIGRVYSHFNQPGGSLGSWTAGLAMSYRAISVDFAYSEPTSYPNRIDPDTSYFYGRIAVNF